LGILTNIVAAEEDEIAAIGESMRPLDEWSGIERRGIDTAKIATLHCLLTGEEFEAGAGSYEPVMWATRAPWCCAWPTRPWSGWRRSDEEALELVADELAATEEFEMEQWEPAEVQALVFELADLARLAESQGQVMFVWMQPLLT
jgi:hypothetical protein